MKPLKLTHAAAGVWELARFALLFVLVVRMAGHSAASLPLLIMPLAAPGLVVGGGFIVLAASDGTAPILERLLRLAKLLEVVSVTLVLLLATLLGRPFAMVESGLLAGTLALDLIFLFLLVSYGNPPDTRPPGPTSLDQGGAP